MLVLTSSAYIADRALWLRGVHPKRIVPTLVRSQRNPKRLAGPRSLGTRVHGPSIKVLALKPSSTEINRSLLLHAEVTVPDEYGVSDSGADRESCDWGKYGHLGPGAFLSGSWGRACVSALGVGGLLFANPMNTNYLTIMSR